MLGIFGNILPPDGVSQYITKAGGDPGDALFFFINNIIKMAGVVAGIYAVIQFIMAGYTYISANGDPKMMERAWAMIWQSMLGLLVIGASFVLAAVIGKLTGINPLEPQIYGPSN